MERVSLAYDISGRSLSKGDTVSTVTGALTGRISDIAMEEETTFVCLRPVHQPYGRGVWHAADRVVYVASNTRQRSKSATARSEDRPTHRRPREP
jgi:hypothetical protein